MRTKTAKNLLVKRQFKGLGRHILQLAYGPSSGSPSPQIFRTNLFPLRAGLVHRTTPA